MSDKTTMIKEVMEILREKGAFRSHMPIGVQRNIADAVAEWGHKKEQQALEGKEKCDVTITFDQHIEGEGINIIHAILKEALNYSTFRRDKITLENYYQ